MQTAQIKIITINMDNMERKKRAYTTPEIKVYPMRSEPFMSPSVTPNGSASGTSNWDADEAHEGGTFYIGDKSSVAPAKDWGNVWEE